MLDWVFCMWCWFSLDLGYLACGVRFLLDVPSQASHCHTNPRPPAYGARLKVQAHCLHAIDRSGQKITISKRLTPLVEGTNVPPTRYKTSQPHPNGREKVGHALMLRSTTSNHGYVQVADVPQIEIARENVPCVGNLVRRMCDYVK